jgi:hypothetical protein
MFTPSQESKNALSTAGSEFPPFVSARVYLSRDRRSLFHVLPDGRIVKRPVDLYRKLLARSCGDSSAAGLRRFFASPMAKVAQAIILWLLRLGLLTWVALHPAAHLPNLAESDK